MKYITSLLFFILFVYNSHSQGLNLMSEDQLNELPELNDDVLGFVSNLPASYSFEEYVPAVLTQSGASCVGFASQYYALSTMYNIRLGIKDPSQKYSHAFDPYFVYSIVKSRDGENCDEGSNFAEAFDILKKEGAKKMLFPPYLVCDSAWDKEKLSTTLPYTKPYSIDEWRYAKVNYEFLPSAKNALYNGIPLIFGVGLTDSFNALSSDDSSSISSSSGLWEPKPYEDRLGGHALTIVGYDDNKFGGAFRVVNSWGRNWGDNGYFWMKYSDFIDNVKAAFIMLIDENIGNENPQINLDSYQRVDYTNNYSMEGQYNSGSYNGYGIYHTDENNTSYVGNFIDGNPNGYFLMLNNEGLYEANIRDGEMFDFDKLGFSDSDRETMKKSLMAKKYFKNLDSSNLLKKARSVKTIYVEKK
ncbi:hypothetical protein OAM76_05020 [Flavobacteriaceae bacterium]|nr:hypothetical protein [Flavobacteriaceae bacterium]